jgi:hypothetical protein
MAQPLITRVEQVVYHRNGICGEGFYVVEFIATAAGSYDDRHPQRLLATVFVDITARQPSNPVVAVVDPTDPTRCFRGDHYADALLAVVAAWDAGETQRWHAMATSTDPLPTCRMCKTAPTHDANAPCPRCAANFAAVGR